MLKVAKMMRNAEAIDESSVMCRCNQIPNSLTPQLNRTVNYYFTGNGMKEKAMNMSELTLLVAGLG